MTSLYYILPIWLYSSQVMLPFFFFLTDQIFFSFCFLSCNTYLIYCILILCWYICLIQVANLICCSMSLKNVLLLFLAWSFINIGTLIWFYTCIFAWETYMGITSGWKVIANCILQEKDARCMFGLVLYSLDRLLHAVKRHAKETGEWQLWVYATNFNYSFSLGLCCLCSLAAHVLALNLRSEFYQSANQWYNEQFETGYYRFGKAWTSDCI